MKLGHCDTGATDYPLFHKQFSADRICVSSLPVELTFIPYCLPDGHGFPIIEHAGFAGVEREACQTFFQYYKLEPPISPILQPELSNPLYLQLL